MRALSQIFHYQQQAALELLLLCGWFIYGGECCTMRCITLKVGFLCFHPIRYRCLRLMLRLKQHFFVLFLEVFALEQFYFLDCIHSADL